MVSDVNHYQILSEIVEHFCLTAEASFAIKQNSLSGNNSVVECDLAKVEVAGSNPVSRSKIYRRGPCTPWRLSVALDFRTRGFEQR